MEITLKNAGKTDALKIKALYLSAFPPEERPPFFLMRYGARFGNGDMLSVYDGEEFVGFAYVVSDERAAYLFFFAIEERFRGKGYGSAVLLALKKRYAGKVLFLAREQLDERAENHPERVRRHRFYLKNGFSDLSVKIKEMTVIYDTMGFGGDIEPRAYARLMKKWCGPLVFYAMRIKMI